MTDLADQDLTSFRTLSVADRTAACLVGLAHLPGLGPATLRRCHLEHGAQESWFDIVSGRYQRVVPIVELLGHPKGPAAERLVSAARRRDVVADLAAQRPPGWRVHVLGARGYPERLAHDPAAPAVLFACGREALLQQPTVAIVGTRKATLAGRELAQALAADLARTGVVVVSGLALGIDGAAHRGAMSAGVRSIAEGSTGPGPAAARSDSRSQDAPIGLRRTGSGDATLPTIGVVASGLDVIYPRRHADLHRSIAESGLLVTEAPAGFRPEPWRFPARNRIIAGLADAVVVVESRSTGGSMHTVEEALRRDVPVLAVPGHPGAPASTGTNDLLFDGAGMARGAQDVLMALGLHASTSQPGTAVGTGTAEGRDFGASPAESELLEVLRAAPSSLGELVAATGRTVEQVAHALAVLEGAGRIGRTGGWYEVTRVGRTVG